MTNRNRARAGQRGQRPAAQQRPTARPALSAQRQEDGAYSVRAGEPAPVDDIFDLDALRHEAAGERFRFKVQGEIFELRTPEETDWLENSKIPERNPTGSDLRPLMRMLLAERYDDFEGLDLQTGQLNGLIEQWMEWHGIEIPESNASRRS